MESRTGCDASLSSPHKVGYLRTSTHIKRRRADPGGPLSPLPQQACHFIRPREDATNQHHVSCGRHFESSLEEVLYLCWVALIQLVTFGFPALFGGAKSPLLSPNELTLANRPKSLVAPPSPFKTMEMETFRVSHINRHHFGAFVPSFHKPRGLMCAWCHVR